MSFDFFTGKSVYTVEKERLYKNGEILAEGIIIPVHVLLGLPGIILVNDPQSDSPIQIRTGEIRSILPENERMNTLTLPTKNRYRVRVEVDCRTREFVVNAVDESHGFHQLNSFFRNIKLLSIQQVNSTDAPGAKEELVC